MQNFKTFLIQEQVLNEAHTVIDLRHPPSALKFWGSEKDPQYINPADGFHFSYNSGNLALHSTNNDIYDAAVIYGQLPNNGYGIKINYPSDNIKKALEGKLYNAFGGIVDKSSKTITISKEYDFKGKKRMRTSHEIQHDQKAFRDLKAYGVTDDFKIKGWSNGTMTVGQFLATGDHVQRFAQNDIPTLYHGTSAKRWETIKKEGLRPGRYDQAYVDLIPGYSEHNVYFATDINSAKFYGKRQAEKDHDNKYVILQISGSSFDPAKFVADDYFARGGTSFKQVKTSIKHGQVGYKGMVMPSKITVAKGPLSA